MVQATVWELSGRDGLAGKEFSGGRAHGGSAVQAPGYRGRRRGQALAGRRGAAAQLVGVADEVAVVGAQVAAEAEGSRPVTLAGLALAGRSAG